MMSTLQAPSNQLPHQQVPFLLEELTSAYLAAKAADAAATVLPSSGRYKK
jgi:hypothetical protein